MPKPSLLSVITRKPSRDRIVRRGLESRSTVEDAESLAVVDPTGGDQKSGIIRGASLIAAGEALGHGAWIDSTTLKQVAELGSGDGIKVRFTHPSMSGDGLGSYLGRAKNFTVEGGQVFGDVHFSKTSRREDGDRGGYVLSLAEEDPAAFGMSIVFDHDLTEESRFIQNYSVDDSFESPDVNNVNNFPHVRLSALHGADFVDEPAANPDGLFHTGPTAEILKQADAVLAYACGLTEEIPEDSGGLSAERLRGYLSRFLDGRGIALTTKEKAGKMSEKTAETTDENVVEKIETERLEAAAETETVLEPAPVEALSKAELSKYVDKFGAVKGLEHFLDDSVSYEEALSLEVDALRKEKELGIGSQRGEDEPAETFTEGAGIKQPKAVSGFQSIVRMAGQSPTDAENN